MLRRTLGKNQKRPKFLIASIIALLLFVLYLPFMHWMFFQTRFPYEGWDFLIPVISLIIAFLNYRRLCKDKVKITPDKRGLILLSVGLFLKVIVFFQASYFIEISSFLCSISGWIIYSYGLKIFSYFIFPILFLLLKLPWGGYILANINELKLRSLLADLTAKLSSLVGMPSTAQGASVLGPHTPSHVISRCIGLHTLDAKLLLGILFLYYSNVTIKIKFWKGFCLVPIIAFINFLRIFSLHITYNLYYGVYSFGQIHEINNHIHKIVLLAVLYVFAFGWPRLGRKQK